MIFETKKIKKQTKKRKNIILDLVQDQDQKDLNLDQEDTAILHHLKIHAEFRDYPNGRSREIVNKDYQEKRKLDCKQKIKFKNELKQKKE